MTEPEATATPAARPRRDRIPAWMAIIAAVLGAIAAVLGSLLVSVLVAVALYADELKPERLADPQFVNDLVTRFPILASSVVATAACLIGVPLLTAKLARASIREALGFRPAPWQAFVLGPIGILALGPTSDALVRWAKEVAPHASLGALEAIDQIVRAHPLWMLWPVIALCPGFSEEIFFRGLVQRSFGFGRWAIAVSALSFSFFHMDPHHVVGVLPLGFYLAWLGARTGTTWVPIVAHTVNNTLALVVGKLAADAEDTPIPLWVLPIGWAVAAACIWGIARVTGDRERWLGPAAADDADRLPASSADGAAAISPDWRVLRRVGARDEVFGYVRQARSEDGAIAGRFQPGPDYEEVAPTLDAEAPEAQGGWALEDLATGRRLAPVRFELDPDHARIVVRPASSAS